MNTRKSDTVKAFRSRQKTKAPSVENKRRMGRRKPKTCATVRKPICLECRNLVWQGFHADCVCTLIDDSLFEDAIELSEVALEGKSEKEIAVIEQQQELRFDKSLANRLMTIPYIVWRRKDRIIYYEGAPRRVKDCPFGFQPLKGYSDMPWI